MAEKPPQIFRDADGRRILFGLRFDADDAERERLKELIESHGGQVVGFSALPKTGYLLVDTTTADGRQQSAARHSPPQRYVVHYSWAELSIAAGRLLPPLLHPPVFVADGAPVKIHLHQSLSHDVAERVNDLIQDSGGDTNVGLEEAHIIVASERHVSYRTLLKRFRNAVKTPLWVLGVLKKGRPLVLGHSEPTEPVAPAAPARPAAPAPMPAEGVGNASLNAPPDFMSLLTSDTRKRPLAKFTPEEDLAFIRYLSDLDLLLAGTLTGNKLYQNMCAENDWARGHTWQSWRQRYMRNKATYIKLIAEEARRTYSTLPPPRKREVQERYKIRKALASERAKRRHENEQIDEFGLDQFIEDPPEEEAEDMRELWAEQMPEEDEPVAPRRRPQRQRQQQRKRVAVSDDELGGDGEEEEEEEDPFADEPVVQDNDADFQASYVATMNNMDYTHINEDNDEPAPPAIENEPPFTASPWPPALPSTAAPKPTFQIPHSSHNAPQRAPPPAQPARQSVQLKWQPVRSARDYAAPQPPPPPPPEAGPSRLPAPAPLPESRLPAPAPLPESRLPAPAPPPESRRDSMTEVERALVSESEYETPTGKGGRKRRKASVSSDDEDARLLLQHNALIAAANPPAPKKKQRAVPVPEQSLPQRQLRPRPGSVVAARAPQGRAASVKTAPALVPVLQADSTTSGDDGAFRPPRNTRARAVREAQTPFTPLPNTRAAQAASSRGTGG